MENAHDICGNGTAIPVSETGLTLMQHQVYKDDEVTLRYNIMVIVKRPN